MEAQMAIGGRRLSFKDPSWKHEGFFVFSCGRSSAKVSGVAFLLRALYGNMKVFLFVIMPPLKWIGLLEMTLVLFLML